MIPIHYEGWKHFRQGRGAIEAEFAAAPEQFRRSVRWLPIGDQVTVGFKPRRFDLALYAPTPAVDHVHLIRTRA